MQIVVGRSGTEMLTNEAGEVTRYPLQSYLFFRLNKHVLVGFFLCVFFPEI